MKCRALQGWGWPCSSFCSILDTAQEVGGCGQVWELKVFYQLAANPLHSINTRCREFLWHGCWHPGQPSFYEGGSCPDCLIHFLSSVSLRCLQRQERDGKGQREADRWPRSERGCRQSRKLLSVLTFGQQKGKTSRVLGRGRTSWDECRDGSAGE